MRALFESYNELANGVLGALDVEMPRIDVSSLRSFATGPRRQPGPPQAPSEPGALPGARLSDAIICLFDTVFRPFLRSIAVAADNPSISEAARLFGQSLPPERHAEGQEALRFARWFGEERAAAEVRPSDLETYVESFGATAPNAAARADALKSFLAFAHKQGIMAERMVSHVRVRRQGAQPKAAAAEQPREVRLTAAGKAALVAELEALKAQRPHIAAEIRAARADGDVRENAPLEAAREAQGQLEARIRDLEGTLRHAVVVDDAGAGATADAARVGSSVVIANLATGAQLSYQLVNAAEARQGTGRLSVESPVGQALVGRRVGDEVQVAAPSGLVRFRIERIEG